MENYKEILKNILEEYQAKAKLKEGEIFVIGCSTSEVVGGRIGKNSSMDVAEDFIDVFLDFADKYKLFLAFQGCEHINRSVSYTHLTLPTTPYV